MKKKPTGDTTLSAAIDWAANRWAQSVRPETIATYRRRIVRIVDPDTPLAAITPEMVADGIRRTSGDSVPLRRGGIAAWNKAAECIGVPEAPRFDNLPNVTYVAPDVWPTSRLNLALIAMVAAGHSIADTITLTTRQLDTVADMARPYVDRYLDANPHRGLVFIGALGKPITRYTTTRAVRAVIRPDLAVGTQPAAILRAFGARPAFWADLAAAADRAGPVA